MMRMMRIRYFFSDNPALKELYTRLPKNLAPQPQPSFLSRLFDKSKESSSYILLKELFQYLYDPPLLRSEFPFIKTSPQFEESWMVMHILILRGRFKEEIYQHDSISYTQLQKLDYNTQCYFFVPYAQYLNPHIPTANFAIHYAQAMHKRLLIYEGELEREEEQGTQNPMMAYKLQPHNYCHLFRTLIYKNRVRTQDPQLLKLCKYYVAHKKYLASLKWEDLMQFKIKWGFQGDIKLINQI